MLDIAGIAGGEQVKGDVVQSGVRGTVAAEHGATDRGEVLDRVTGAIFERDQLAVKHPASAKASQWCKQPAERFGEAGAVPRPGADTPVGSGLNENREESIFPWAECVARRPHPDRAVVVVVVLSFCVSQSV